MSGQEHDQYPQAEYFVLLPDQPVLDFGLFTTDSRPRTQTFVVHSACDAEGGVSWTGDWIVCSPTHFGQGHTVITVRLRPEGLGTGGASSTEVRLQMADQTVTVPVVCQALPKVAVQPTPELAVAVTPAANSAPDVPDPGVVGRQDPDTKATVPTTDSPAPSITPPTLIEVLAGHMKAVMSVAFSPDGGTLASGSGDETIKLWDLATGREIRNLKGHSDWINSVAFSPDGSMLTSGSDDQTIKLWDVATGREIRSLKGHSDWINSVAFSPDGKMLASGSRDMTIKLWDVATDRKLRTLAAPKGWVRIVIDMVRGRELLDRVVTVAFSPDGRMLASASSQTVRLWDVAGIREIRTLAGHANGASSVAFSPDGRTLASASWHRSIRLWDLATGREIRTLEGHTDVVRSIAFSPDGRMVASGSVDKTIKLWDVVSGREVRSLAGHTDSVNAVAFSPDGRMVASGSRDKTIKLWDVSRA